MPLRLVPVGLSTVRQRPLTRSRLSGIAPEADGNDARSTLATKVAQRLHMLIEPLQPARAYLPRAGRLTINRRDMKRRWFAIYALF